MLCAMLTFTTSFFSARYASKESERRRGSGGLAYLFAIVFGLATLGTGVIGIIRFVKWVWRS